MCEIITRLPQFYKAIDRPAQTHVVIHGDSRVALACAQRIANQRVKVKLKGSKRFQRSTVELADLVRTFAGVETHWRSRTVSVAVFGH